MITGDALLAAVQGQTFIRDGEVGGVEGIKYDFHLSSLILKAKFTRPVDATELSESDRRSLTVEPGEVVFVLTSEQLDLPMDVMAQLSPKRKLSHEGILTLGGFSIDPGYQGRLLLGLYNFSSTPFILRPGKKLVAATFFHLDETEIGAFPSPKDPILDFPDELVATMQKYQPMAAQAMADAVQRLQAELTILRDDIRSHSEWYKRFEVSLERHDKQIGELIGGLTVEKESLEKGEDKISTALRKIDSKLSWVKGAAAVIFALVSLIVIPLMIAWMQARFFPPAPLTP